MFTTLSAAFQAYFSNNIEAQEQGLIYIEKEYNSILLAAKQLDFSLLENLVNNYLEQFNIDNVVSILFTQAEDLFTLELLIINNFDDLKTMPYHLLFPLIQKAIIISQNNINTPIENTNDKSHFLEACPNLQALMLEDNKANTYYALHQLKSLEIHSEYPIAIKKEIAELKHLEYLKIVASYYTKLCPEIAQLSQLKKLENFIFNSVIGANIMDLYRDALQNNLTYLSQCPQLESLTITLDEYIKTLPELALLKQIKSLDLYNISHNFFYTLPALLAENTQLQKLHTYIDSIPRLFSKLDETANALREKYDFYFDSERNPYNAKKYFSQIDIFY